jgi:hypothetical protein
MSNLLGDVDASILAALLAVTMFASWSVAWRLGRAHREAERELPASKFNDAIQSLLGLLMAFTFSMSLVKHEQRRQMAVTDSNAIGDFYSCVGLVKDPMRSELQSMVRQYVEHRLALARMPSNERNLDENLAQIHEMHRQMHAAVQRAIEAGTATVVPLVNTYNALTSAHASRLSAIRERLPPSIVVMLCVAAVLCVALMGRQQGASKEWRPGAALGFIALVCMVVWVTLDLNQPRRGWITVSQEPLQQLLTSMDSSQGEP